MTPSILVTSSGRHVLASKPRGGSTYKTPEREGANQTEGGADVEIDERVLMHIIDARFSENISKWYQSWLLPLHNENKEKMEKMESMLTRVLNAMEQAKGGFVVAKAGMTLADKILAGAAGLGLFILGHFWK